MDVIKIRNGEQETKNKNWDRKYSGNPHNSLKWRITTRKKGLNRRLSFPAPRFRFLVPRSPLSVSRSPYSVLRSALSVPVFSNIHTKTKLLNAWQSSHWSTAGNQARIILHRWNRPDSEPVWGEIKYSCDNLLCTRVVYSLWYCLYLVPKENKCLHCCFEKGMMRKMWSCQLCTHNQCAVLCAFTVGYISVAIANVFCSLMPILMLFISLFRGGKLQIPSLWNDTFFARATYYNLPKDVVRNCTDRRLLQNVAAINDNKMRDSILSQISVMRITKCIYSCQMPQLLL